MNKVRKDKFFLLALRHGDRSVGFRVKGKAQLHAYQMLEEEVTSSDW